MYPTLETLLIALAFLAFIGTGYLGEHLKKKLSQKNYSIWKLNTRKGAVK